MTDIQDNNPAPDQIAVAVRRNLRVKEFCDRAPMAKSTFWELVKAGKIPTIKFGSLTVIPFEEGERLLREGTN